MGTLSNFMKDQYTKLVEQRRNQCLRFPSVVSFYEAYERAVNMEERIYSLYTYESDACLYNIERRKQLISNN